MASRTSVVLSQTPSSHPARRQVEEAIVGGLLLEPGIEVIVIPSLYDLSPQSTGLLALQGISGHLIVCAWLYPRAARWILARQGIEGQLGTTLLEGEADTDEEEVGRDDDSLAQQVNGKPRVIAGRSLPRRFIHCLDLRVSNRASDYLQEIRRIHAEHNVPVVALNGSPLPAGAAATGTPAPRTPFDPPSARASSAEVHRIDEESRRRWYPVIDYSRCTNCMECIDFCLFGVYGIDRSETILVEQPDNCRKGCPACSRVCPENAIIFPHHKTPAIAGSPEIGASLKIDLSELFGAPDGRASPIEVAAAERDEHLRLAGREAVGLNGAAPQAPLDPPSLPADPEESVPEKTRDELDALIEQLDGLDL